MCVFIGTTEPCRLHSGHSFDDDVTLYSECKICETCADRGCVAPDTAATECAKSTQHDAST